MHAPTIQTFCTSEEAVYALGEGFKQKYKSPFSLEDKTKQRGAAKNIHLEFECRGEVFGFGIKVLTDRSFYTEKRYTKGKAVSAVAQYESCDVAVVISSTDPANMNAAWSTPCNKHPVFCVISGAKYVLTLYIKLTKKPPLPPASPGGTQPPAPPLTPRSDIEQVTVSLITRVPHPLLAVDGFDDGSGKVSPLRKIKPLEDGAADPESGFVAMSPRSASAAAAATPDGDTTASPPPSAASASAAAAPVPRRVPMQPATPPVMPRPYAHLTQPRNNAAPPEPSFKPLPRLRDRHSHKKRQNSHSGSSSAGSSPSLSSTASYSSAYGPASPTSHDALNALVEVGRFFRNADGASSDQESGGDMKRMRFAPPVSPTGADMLPHFALSPSANGAPSFFGDQYEQSPAVGALYSKPMPMGVMDWSGLSSLPSPSAPFSGVPPSPLNPDSGTSAGTLSASDLAASASEAVQNYSFSLPVSRSGIFAPGGPFSPADGSGLLFAYNPPSTPISSAMPSPATPLEALASASSTGVKKEGESTSPSQLPPRRPSFARRASVSGVSGVTLTTPRLSTADDSSTSSSPSTASDAAAAPSAPQAPTVTSNDGMKRENTTSSEHSPSHIPLQAATPTASSLAPALSPTSRSLLDPSYSRLSIPVDGGNTMSFPGSGSSPSGSSPSSSSFSFSHASISPSRLSPARMLPYGASPRTHGTFLLSPAVSSSSILPSPAPIRTPHPCFSLSQKPPSVVSAGVSPRHAAINNSSLVSSLTDLSSPHARLSFLSNSPRVHPASNSLDGLRVFQKTPPGISPRSSYPAFATPTVGPKAFDFGVVS